MPDKFEKYCPFINGQCRTNCTFHTHNIATSSGITVCLIFAKLDDINECQHDDLAEILNKTN